MTNDHSGETVLTEAIDYSNPTTICPVECVNVLIQKRAYELFVERGRQLGFEAADWISAEREIKHHLGQ